MTAYIAEHGDRNDTLYKIRQLVMEMDMSCQWWENGQGKPADDRMKEKYFIPKLFTVWQDYMLLDLMTANNNYLLMIRDKVRASGRDWSWNEIRKRLENFVSNIAVMQLQGDSEGMQQRLKVIYQEQKKYRQQMFHYVLTCLTFKESDVEELEQLLLTPTVDNIDQRLIISAMTINGLMAYDPLKTKLLINVYRKSLDLHVKHYALVGWTLNLPVQYYPCTTELKKMVKRLVDNDVTVREDIAQLQIQLGYCLSAGKDSKEFQKAVMPDIIKASNMRLTKNGLEVVEEDPMDDILGRSDTEKKMEELEEKMRSFIDKRNQGMDLFFHGFSRMKHFTFFSELSNWLMPFSHDNPDIADAIEKTGGEYGFLNLMLDAPICDNDKYSFVFAFLSIMDKMPSEIMEQCKMMPPRETNYQDWMSNPAILRRNYLQSLYRFFELFPYASSFRNPFKDTYYEDILGDGYVGSPAVIASNFMFRDTRFEDDMFGLVKHFIRRKNHTIAKDILASYDHDREDSFELCYLRALVNMDNDCFVAQENLGKCLDFRPDSMQVKKLYAKILYTEYEYEDALEIYNELMEEQPDNTKWMFCYALCCDKVETYENSLNILFKLNYLSPDDSNVNILLAKALLMLGRAAETDKYLDKVNMGNVDEDAREDYVVVKSMCLLAQNRRMEAARFFSNIVTEATRKEWPTYDSAYSNMKNILYRYKDSFPEIYGMPKEVFDLFVHHAAKCIITRE
ncbi:MAG: tetratricopeptide repeat protein [Prevotella sp.]